MGILGDKLSYLPGEGEDPGVEGVAGVAGVGQEPIYERRGEQIYRQPYNRLQEVRQVSFTRSFVWRILE